MGEDCGCEQRKEKLNKLFPYARTMSDDEISIYESLKPSINTGKLKGNQASTIVKIYNKIFGTNKQVSSCSPCVKSIIDQLEKVYLNSCKNGKPNV